MSRRWAGPLEFQNPGREKILSSFPKFPDYFWGPPRFISIVNQDPFAMVTRSGPNVDHSPPPSVEVKSKWSHTPAPTIHLHDVNREFLTYLTSVTKKKKL
jgi:hypothetical protein